MNIMPCDILKQFHHIEQLSIFVIRCTINIILFSIFKEFFMTHRFIILLCTCFTLIHSTNEQSFQAQPTMHKSSNIFKSLTYELKNPAYQTEILPNDFGY